MKFFKWLTSIFKRKQVQVFLKDDLSGLADFKLKLIGRSEKTVVRTTVIFQKSRQGDYDIYIHLQGHQVRLGSHLVFGENLPLSYCSEEDLDKTVEFFKKPQLHNIKIIREAV